MPIDHPRVSQDARANLSLLMGEKGVPAIVATGREIIRTKHAPLAGYIIRLGQRYNTLSTEGPWPLAALKMGASLSIVAYQDSGYSQEVDECAIEFGTLLAELDGIPDAYLLSLNADSGLSDVPAEVIEIDHIRDKGGGIVQMLGIGAGCARHYLQQAITAA